MTELVDSPVQEKIAAVNKNDKIKVFTGHRVYSISGAPGMFDVMIRPDGPWIERLVQGPERVAWQPSWPRRPREEEETNRRHRSEETPAEAEEVTRTHGFSS